MAKRTIWSLEAEARCTNCDWESDYDDWKGNETVEWVNTQAARHTNETGHTTRIEWVRCVQYSPGADDILGVTKLNHPVCDNHPEIHGKTMTQIMSEQGE